MTKEDLKKYIQDIPDFPKRGIIFKDISPLLSAPEPYQLTINLLSAALDPTTDIIISPEARGFLFGPQVAMKNNLPFVMIRKPGKLPGRTASVDYELEYGANSFEIIKNYIQQGTRVTIIDDILATGGSANGMIQLIEKLGGKVISALFLAELTFLKGADKINLPNQQVVSLISY